MEELSLRHREVLTARAEARYTAEFLAPYRHVCDPLADEAAAALFRDVRGVVPPGYSDLLTACQTFAADGSDACRRFLETVRAVPDWVDFDDFAEGEALFRRNGVLTFLIGVSVLIASYGGYKDNKVLALSGRLSDETSFRRAVETALFTMEVTTPGELRPGGVGWRAVLNVRLLHARVRQLCYQIGFDTKKYDQPINQEAMCGANMLFSHGVIRALELLGVSVSDAEKESYHALWRYAGWLMGVDLALLPETHGEEVVLFDRHQYDYRPDVDTVRLYEGTLNGIVQGARALPLWLTLLGGGLMRSRPFLKNFVGYTVNNTLRDFLGLRPSFGWRILFGGIKTTLFTLSALQHALPPLKRGMLRLQSSLMERIVITLLDGDAGAYREAGRLNPAK